MGKGTETTVCCSNTCRYFDTLKYLSGSSECHLSFHIGISGCRCPICVCSCRCPICVCSTACAWPARQSISSWHFSVSCISLSGILCHPGPGYRDRPMNPFVRLDMSTHSKETMTNETMLVDQPHHKAEGSKANRQTTGTSTGYIKPQSAPSYDALSEGSACLGRKHSKFVKYCLLTGLIAHNKPTDFSTCAK